MRYNQLLNAYQCYSKWPDLWPFQSNILWLLHKHRFPGHQISWVSEGVIEYTVFLHGLAQQWRPRNKQNLAQRQSRGFVWWPNFEYMHSAGNARDITLDDENNYSVVIMLTRECHLLHMQCQPEACASDLGDDQSRYSLNIFCAWGGLRCSASVGTRGAEETARADSASEGDETSDADAGTTPVNDADPSAVAASDVSKSVCYL